MFRYFTEVLVNLLLIIVDKLGEKKSTKEQRMKGTGVSSTYKQPHMGREKCGIDIKFAGFLQKTEFLKRYRSLQRKVEISHSFISVSKVVALLCFLLLMCKDQQRRRLPKRRKPKVFSSRTECQPCLYLCRHHHRPHHPLLLSTADSPASDTFLEGKLKTTAGCGQWLKEERNMRR